MDPASTAIQVGSLVVAGAVGWQVRSAFDRDPAPCNCACTCKCISEVGFSSFTSIFFILVVGGLLLGVWWIADRLPVDSTKVPSPSKGKNGIFGSTGKLSILA